jgi:hypothetical protein
LRKAATSYQHTHVRYIHGMHIMGFYGNASAVKDKGSAMGTPVSVQFGDGLGHVCLFAEIGQSDFDGDIVPVLGPAVQPRLLLRVRAQVRIKVKRRGLRPVKLTHSQPSHTKGQNTGGGGE